MSHGSIDYPRITADIQSLAAQLEPEHHWTTTPTFWVAFVAMLAACVAAYPVVRSFFADQSLNNKNQPHGITVRPQSPPSLSQGKK